MKEKQLYMSELKNFLDSEGRLKIYPSKYKHKIISLFYLASKFESGKRYSEKEINQVLKNWHSFEDWAMLRREMYNKHFFDREENCSIYWLEDVQPTLADFGIF